MRDLNEVTSCLASKLRYNHIETETGTAHLPMFIYSRCMVPCINVVYWNL